MTEEAVRIYRSLAQIHLASSLDILAVNLDDTGRVEDAICDPGTGGNPLSAGTEEIGSRCVLYLVIYYNINLFNT